MDPEERLTWLEDLLERREREIADLRLDKLRMEIEFKTYRDRDPYRKLYEEHMLICPVHGDLSASFKRTKACLKSSDALIAGEDE
jgi:hypothetical protein